VPSLNKAIVMGHVGRDPELRYTPSGKAVATFSVATNRKVGDNLQTEWHSIVVWERQAEFASKSITKGALVLAEGRLQTREWEGQSGEKRSRTEIVADRVLLCKDKNGNGTADEGIQADTLPF
jgi:single-strand DNA-binding protein